MAGLPLLKKHLDFLKLAYQIFVIDSPLAIE